MNKPRWQRGKLLRDRWYPEVVGKFVWVSGAYRGSTCDPNNLIIPDDDVVLTHIFEADGGECAFDRTAVELLPDFAEDVPLIPWTEFLASCKESHEQR